MKTYENEHTNPDNQDVETNGEAASEKCRYPADGDACDNMAGEGDTASCENRGAAGAEGTAVDDANIENIENPPLTPEEEVAIWKDKFVRLSAEYDNYRKRTFKEKLDLINAGGEDVVRSMLEVLDDMDRALEAIAKTEDLEAVKHGMVLIDTKLRGALRGKGLSEIEAVGSELDTDLHEAVARVEIEERELKGKIIDVVQKGYKLKDKIIRYAKVVVGQ